jgi:hypothetical protein
MQQQETATPSLDTFQQSHHMPNGLLNAQRISGSKNNATKTEDYGRRGSEKWLILLKFVTYIHVHFVDLPAKTMQNVRNNCCCNVKALSQKSTSPICLSCVMKYQG